MESNCIPPTRWENKVVIISGSYPDLRCGVGDYTRKLISHLRAEGLDVRLLTTDDPLIRRETYIYPIIKRWNLAAISKIISFIRKEEPCLVNLQVPTIRYKSILNAVSLLPFLVKTIFRDMPFVLTAHDYSISRSIFKIFFLPLFLFPDAVIMTNDEDINEAVKSFPFIRRKIRKIRMGPTVEIKKIDPEKTAHFRGKISYREGDRLISTIGFLKKDRYIDVMIKAFQDLSAEDDHLKFLILGDSQKSQDISYKNYISRLILSLGLQGKIFMPGFRDEEEVSFYLSLSELGILLYERGVSLRRTTLINYLVREVPVIANTNAHYGTDVELAGSGAVLTIEKIEPVIVYEKVKEILYDREAAANMKRAMASLRKKLEWEKSASEARALFLKLGEDKGKDKGLKREGR